VRGRRHPNNTKHAHDSATARQRDSATARQRDSATHLKRKHVHQRGKLELLANDGRRFQDDLLEGLEVVQQQRLEHQDTLTAGQLLRGALQEAHNAVVGAEYIGGEHGLGQLTDHQRVSLRTDAVDTTNTRT